MIPLCLPARPYSSGQFPDRVSKPDASDALPQVEPVATETAGVAVPHTLSRIDREARSAVVVKRTMDPVLFATAFRLTEVEPPDDLQDRNVPSLATSSDPALESRRGHATTLGANAAISSAWSASAAHRLHSTRPGLIATFLQLGQGLSTLSLTVEHSIGIGGCVTAAPGSLVLTDLLCVAGGIVSKRASLASPTPRIRVTVFLRPGQFSRAMRPSFSQRASARHTRLRFQCQRRSKTVIAGSQAPAGRPSRTS